MKQTPNINLPILEQGDKYLKETQNEAFSVIDREIAGLNSAISVLDNVEGSIIDTKNDVETLKNETNTLKASLNDIASNVIPNIQTSLDTNTSELNSIFVNVKFPPKEWNLEGLKGYNNVNDDERLKLIISKATSLFDNVKLYFPNGNYLLNSLVIIPKGVVIEGESRNGTVIKKGNFKGDLFHINKDGITNTDRYYNFQLENMTLKSDNSYQEGGALFIENSLRVVIRNVIIEYFNGNGITFYGTCFYPHFDSVFIHYCSSSPNGRYSIGDTIPNIDNAGFSGNNLRCAVIDFAEGGLNSRGGEWGKASADLTTINCNFEANDVGVRWKSADSHFVSTVFQGNAMHELIVEESINVTECHFETDAFNNYKMSSELVLIKSKNFMANNCNFWGNSASHANSAIKCDSCYYLNIIGGRITGFKYAIDSMTTTRLYSIGVDFSSKDNSPYFNGSIVNKIVINHTVGGLLLDENLSFGNNAKVDGNIIPLENNKSNIGSATNKYNTAYITSTYIDKMFINNQVSIAYNTTDPNGTISATKGSLCLTPFGLYVREGGNFTDTVWVKK